MTPAETIADLQRQLTLATRTILRQETSLKALRATVRQLSADVTGLTQEVSAELIATNLIAGTLRGE